MANTDRMPLYRLGTVVTALLAVQSTGCSFISQHFSKANYGDGTVGALVNEKFKGLVDDCKIVPPDEKPKPADYVGYDFVPGNLSIRITKGKFRRSPIVADMHPSNLFLYPFTEKEKAAYLASANDPKQQPPQLNKQHIISEDGAKAIKLSVDIAPAQKSGLQSFDQRQSCAAYLKARAEAGVSLPVASVNSSLQAQFSTGGRAHAAGGFFESPLSAMLEGGSRSLYATLLLWQQYKRTPELVKSPKIYALNSFGGVAMMTAVATANSNDTTGTAGGGYTGGPASVSASLQARYEESFAYKGEDFETYIVELTDSNFNELPTPVEIRETFLKSFASRAIVAPAVEMLTGREHEHSFTMPGVPPQVCEAGTWSIETSPTIKIGGQDVTIYNAKPTVLVRSTVRSDSDLPACEFRIRGTPNQQALTVGSTPAITYKLINSEPLSAENKENVLALQVSGLQFKANPSPQVTLSSGFYSPTPWDIAAISVRHIWSIPLNLYDNDNPVAPSQSRPVTASIGRITCESSSIPVSAIVKRDEASAQYSVVVSTSQAMPPPVAGYRFVTCDAEIKLVLPLASGASASADRIVKTKLDLPVSQSSPTPPTPIDTRDFIKRVDDQDRLLDVMRAPPQR